MTRDGAARPQLLAEFVGCQTQEGKDCLYCAQKVER